MLKALDQSVFYLINRDWSCSFFNGVMPIITVLGAEEFLLAVAVLSLLFRKKIRKFGVLLLVGLGVATVFVDFLKPLVARPRPFAGPLQVHLLIGSGGFSFPSAHAVNAFLAATLTLIFSKKCALWYLAALVVAFSRVYIGVHYPSDVAAGALIGALLGYGALRVLGKWEKKSGLKSRREPC